MTKNMTNVISSASFLKHPRTPPSGSAMDYQTADSEHLMKRLRAGQSDEVLMVETFFFF